jgi:superfamily II DNA/RNA helicase
VYVHRVGRTGRAGQAGTAVTLLTPQDAELEAALTQQLGGPQQSESEHEDSGQKQGLRPFERLTKAAVEGLRYRGEDIARSLTKSAVKEVDVFLSLLKGAARGTAPLPAIMQALLCVSPERLACLPRHRRAKGEWHISLPP